MEPEKAPENKGNTTITDIFGFGKMYEKLPLQKINALMAFSLAAVLILFTFYGVLYLRKTPAEVDQFPTAWDMRTITAVAIIIVLICIFNYTRKKAN